MEKHNASNYICCFFQTQLEHWMRIFKNFSSDVCSQMLSDFLYQAPADKMTKLLVQQNIPVYLYVLNTTIEAFKLPLWKKVPHDIEHYLLAGAPFMDIGKCSQQ